MDAIILVGGQGTRLRPLTAHRHKSLVPVLNRPAILYLFSWLRRNGVGRVVLALGQANEDLAEALLPGPVEGLEVCAVFEQRRLESGGAIRNAVAQAEVEGRFLVLNGDIYVDFELGEAIRAHEANSAVLTLALSRVADPSAFGVAVVDEQRLVTGFVEKPRGKAPSNLVNAGVWIFEPELVAQIPEGAVRVEETLFPSLVGRRERVLGHPFDGLWADIGTPARYLELNVELVRADGRATVAPEAKVASPAGVVDSVVGEGSTLGDGAQFEQSVAWECVEVGPGATVRGSVLADQVRVGAGATLEGVVAGMGAVIEEGAKPPAGTVLQPGERYDRRA